MFHYYWLNKCFQVISHSNPFCLQGSVDQRLKWAVGANPGLQEVWTLLLSLSYILIWCKSLYYQVVHIWWKSLLSGGWPSCRRASRPCRGSQATWGLGEVYHQHRGGLLAGGRSIVWKSFYQSLSPNSLKHCAPPLPKREPVITSSSESSLFAGLHNQLNFELNCG